jgi:formate/nitrite transporter FocA (FNT family)
VPGGFLLENLGYTFGFVIVIMARQQLFTENTVTAVLPVMQNPTLGNFGLLMRLWSVVLLGNIIGTGIAAWAFEYMPIFDEPTRDAFVKIGMDVMKNTRSRCSLMPSSLAGLSPRWSGCFLQRERQNCGDYIDDLADCAG